MLRKISSIITRSSQKCFGELISLAAIIVVSVGTLAFSPTANAETILRVDRTYGVEAPTGNPPAQSWQDAYRYLQNALEYAAEHATSNNQFEIWVATGVYKAHEHYPAYSHCGTPNDYRCYSFSLKTHVRLYGGFSGSETKKNARRPSINVTILSGDINGDDDPLDPLTYTDNSWHILKADRVRDSAVCDGFTIMSGNAFDAPAPEQGALPEAGAGLLLLGDNTFSGQCRPRILRCNFVSNRAADGGAVYGWIGRFDGPHFYNCQFLGNAGGRGGAVHIGYSAAAFGQGQEEEEEELSGPEVRFINPLFAANFASINGGAGWFHYDARVEFWNATLADNISASKGGALYHDLSGQNPPTQCVADIRGLMLHNVITWDNTCNDCQSSTDERHSLWGIRYITNSCIENLSEGCYLQNGNITSDPLFIGMAITTCRATRPHCTSATTTR